MPKVIIEFNGNFGLKEINHSIEIRKGDIVIHRVEDGKEYEITLPQNAKVKVHIEESDVFKENIIEYATLKIDSKVDVEKLVESAFDRLVHKIKARGIKFI